VKNHELHIVVIKSSKNSRETRQDKNGIGKVAGLGIRKEALCEISLINFITQLRQDSVFCTG
jgi:hypothetical protein